MKILCLEANSSVKFEKPMLLLNSSCFGCFRCNRYVSVKTLYPFHINPLLSVSWGERRF